MSRRHAASFLTTCSRRKVVFFPKKCFTESLSHIISFDFDIFICCKGSYRHEVLLPTNQNYNKIYAILNFFKDENIRCFESFG